MIENYDLEYVKREEKNETTPVLYSHWKIMDFVPLNRSGKLFAFVIREAINTENAKTRLSKSELEILRQEMILLIDLNGIVSHVDGVHGIISIIFNPMDGNLLIITGISIWSWNGEILRQIHSLGNIALTFDSFYHEIKDTVLILAGHHLIHCGPRISILNIKTGEYHKVEALVQHVFPFFNFGGLIKLTDSIIGFQDHQKIFAIFDIETLSIIKKIPIDDMQISGKLLYVPEMNNLLGWRSDSKDNELLTFNIENMNKRSLLKLEEKPIKTSNFASWDHMIANLNYHRHFSEICKGYTLFRLDGTIYAVNVLTGARFVVYGIKHDPPTITQPRVRFNPFGEVFVVLADGLCMLESHVIEEKLTTRFKNRIGQLPTTVMNLSFQFQ